MEVGDRSCKRSSHTNTHISERGIVLFDDTNEGAADSISLNIAEGSTGQSNPEQLRFLGYAQRSGLEVLNCLYLAIKRNYIDQIIFDKFLPANRKVDSKNSGI